MSVTSYGFIIWADAHLLFSGTRSGSACAVFVPLSQKEVIKIDELHVYQVSGKFCLPKGFISSQLWITSEQWLSQQASQGRRSSPQGPWPAVVLGCRQQQPLPWLCFSQRITDISLALTLIKCIYSE